MKLDHEARFRDADVVDQVLLPQTKTEMDELVHEIAMRFRLPDDENTYDAIQTMVLHLPSNQAHASMEYFGYSVQKQIANRVAWEGMQVLKEKRKKEMNSAQDVAAPNESMLSNQGI